MSGAVLLYLSEYISPISPFRSTMRFTSSAALSASSLLLATGAAASDSFEVLVPRASMTYVACYSSSEGLTNQTSYTFQSTGWCQDRCVGDNAAVFGLTGGSDCLCGDELPPSSDKVSDSKCSQPCDGWPQAMCMSFDSVLREC